MLCRLLRGRVPLQGVPLGSHVRWRHTRIVDLRPSERLKKHLRGTPGPLASIRGPSENSALRYELTKARSSAAILDLLRAAPSIEAPEVGKAMQRCGELRDYESLVEVRELARERNVDFNTETYGILMTAASRTSRGVTGRCLDGRFSSRVLSLGRAAFEEMRSSRCFVPMLPCYGAALGLCARIGDPDWAGEIWSEMLEKGLRPSIVEYTQYFMAVLSRNNDVAWQNVEGELQSMRQNQVSPDSPFLGALIDSAGTQYRLDRVDWLWKEVAPQVPRLNPSPYGCTAKAFILCGVPERVPPLRQDMVEHRVRAMFRNFQFEAQAWLLMLHADPASKEAAEGFRDAASSAHQAVGRQESGFSTISLAEQKDLGLMEHLAEHLLQGRPVSLRDARVMNWPWRPLAAAEGAAPAATTATAARASVAAQSTPAATGAPAAATAAAASPAATPAAAASDADPPLPAGWRATLDPASGRHYYWREADPAGSTTWELPT